MFLRSLHLTTFRNYAAQTVHFSAQKAILVGANAQGKSNLLEAVELLSTLRSHRTSRDGDFIYTGAPLAQIDAELQRRYSNVELGMVLRPQGRRTVKLNGENLRKNLDLLGVLNTVQFSCLDLDLVRGAPEMRRDWVDRLLMQLEPVYGHIWQQYQQILKQRNALLKNIQKLAGQGDRLLSSYQQQLPLWNEQLVSVGTRISRRRSRVLHRLIPIAQQWHRQISGYTEELAIAYQGNVPWTVDETGAVQQGFWQKIAEKSQIEQYQGKTLVGPHRDEIEFNINQTPARFYGSQGQQRTLVLALKLAELQLIEEVVGEPPLLLLDDVLAELDLQRQNQLLEAINQRFQTLITTTHLQAFDAQWCDRAQIFQVQGGQVLTPIK